jgi:hypothetical protein
MGTPTLSIEVRWRVAGSGQPWSVGRYPPDATNITIPGLIRGVTYEGQARSIGPGGLASEWVPITFEVPNGTRTSATGLPPVVAGNVASRWISGTQLSWSGNSTTITISVSAGVLQVGDKQISYGPSSAEITGTAGEVRTVYLYYDDPYWQGGSRTLGVTTDSVASMAAAGRILIDRLTVTFASSSGGTTGGGGDVGGGGGASGPRCPSEDAWLLIRGADGEPVPIRWRDAQEGDYAMLEDGRWGRISHLRRTRVECVRVVFGDGRTLTCSRTAPLRRAGGGALLAPATVGQALAYLREGEWTVAVVERVEDIGPAWVIQFTCEDSFVWTGDSSDHLLAHHNIKAEP